MLPALIYSLHLLLATMHATRSVLNIAYAKAIENGCTMLIRRALDVESNHVEEPRNILLLYTEIPIFITK